jgi:predicted methyltransferase
MTISRGLLLSALIVAVGFCAAPVMAQKAPAYVTKAVGDAKRPAADKEADSYRMPAASLAFSRVKPGDQVLELLGIGGYYTRMLSKVVGAKGHIYTTIPPALQDNPKFAGPEKAIAADPDYSNVTIEVQPTGAPSAPVPVDMVWTSDNYHDLHNKGPVGADDIDAFNRAVFAALKPGGIFFVIDHMGAPGTGFSQTNSLHRIEAKTVREEVEKAGFVFDGSSEALHRANEDFTTHSTFKDEQFIFRFRKPK